MTARRLAVALLVVLVTASVGVGAATPGATDASAVGTPAQAANTTPLGHSISSAMQASTAQAAGAVENGMWAAAYANASNDTERRELIRQRYGELNGTIAELQAERRALKERFRDGELNRSTYLARLSAIVGRLAALGEAIETTGERGAAVGVNDTRLDALRTQARNLSGAEVSRLARNLTGGQGSPGPPGLFEGPPGRSGDRGGANAGNGSSNGNGGQGPPSDGGNGSDGNGSQGGDGQGPPDDKGSGSAGDATETATPSGD